ncbi:hypothetical protein [Xanthobacter sediminis]
MTQHRAQSPTPKPADPAACRTAEATSRQLDDELEQSFPASDPPSMVRDAPAEVCGEEKPQAGKKVAHKEKGSDRHG